jgi:hypothetical protein
LLNRLGWEQHRGRVLATYGPGVGYHADDEWCVSVIGKTDFSFDGRASGSVQSVVLAAGIPTVDWVSGVLVARLHTRGTFSASARATILVENISIVPEEPQTIFADTAAPLASVQYVAGTLAPNLGVVAFVGAIGPMVQVRLIFDQQGTAAAAQTFSISVDLIGRQG